MDHTYSDYRHPRHDEILAALQEGLSANRVSDVLGVNRRSVVRVREMYRIPAGPQSASRVVPLETKVERNSTVTEDGHIMWSGRTNYKVPYVKHLGAYIPVSHIAFKQRTGRQPVGIVKAECGVDYCLNPYHISDQKERTQVRTQLRALAGLPDPWAECPEGHDWATSGRIDCDLVPYCTACDTISKRRIRETQRKEAS